jgi:sulfofructose kinase
LELSVIDVIGFGESSVDYIHVVSELPRPGASKLPITSRFSSCGGQVATTLAACAALGLKSAYLGPAGDDENGRRIREELRGRGVDLSRLIIRDAAARYAVILVEEGSGERVVLWDRDPRLDVDPGSFTPESVAGARVVHVDSTDEAAAIALARLGRQAGAIVTCDIDTVTARTCELLAHVTVPIVAEDVPRQLTGFSDVEPALRAMRHPHHDVVCVTRGERGAAAIDRDRFIEVPAFAVDAVDTTGAGDVFRAGIIYGVLQQWPTGRTLRFANAAAAVSCTRAGAMNGVPALEAVQAYL